MQLKENKKSIVWDLSLEFFYIKYLVWINFKFNLNCRCSRTEDEVEELQHRCENATDHEP